MATCAQLSAFRLPPSAARPLRTIRPQVRPQVARGGAVCARASGAAGLRTDLQDLPGDPSLLVSTNVDMGDKKMEFMKAASQAVASCLSKPESYVAVCVQDNLDLIWGGSADPAALCTVQSLGAINLENNKALSAELCALFEEFGISPTRYYVNFYDLEEQNIGYDGATFAG